MRLGDIFDILNEISSFEMQEKWDNSGLLIGNKADTIKRIYLSLDIESAMLDKIEEDSLIITHHPLIFSGLKQLNFMKYPSSLIQQMIQKKISLISMHTNFDKTHLNRFVASKLGYKICTEESFVVYMEVDQSFDDFILHVKSIFGLDPIRVVRAKEWIGRCAITTGSGGDLISKIEADCFLTGDLKYHQALEANENNLSLIDIGHFESECYFAECLSEHLKNLPLKVIISNSKNPFEYI